MRPVFPFRAAALLTAFAPAMLKEAPAPGTLPHNEVVFVDDGSCPAGQVSKQTGGNTKLGISRTVECVPRP
ncbi:MAG: DUF6719 family protein [Pseudomonadota bacterium]